LNYETPNLARTLEAKKKPNPIRVRFLPLISFLKTVVKLFSFAIIQLRVIMKNNKVINGLIIEENLNNSNSFPKI